VIEQIVKITHESSLVLGISSHGIFS